jgi:hypothetical protein
MWWKKNLCGGEVFGSCHNLLYFMALGFLAGVIRNHARTSKKKVLDTPYNGSLSCPPPAGVV